MENRIYLPEDLAEGKEVILVDGLCYQRVGPSPKPPDTFEVDDVFETCEQCACPPGCWKLAYLKAVVLSARDERFRGDIEPGVTQSVNVELWDGIASFPGICNFRVDIPKVVCELPTTFSWMAQFDYADFDGLEPPTVVQMGGTCAGTPNLTDPYGGEELTQEIELVGICMCPLGAAGAYLGGNVIPPDGKWPEGGPDDWVIDGNILEFKWCYELCPSEDSSS